LGLAQDLDGVRRGAEVEVPEILGEAPRLVVQVENPEGKPGDHLISEIVRVSRPINMQIDLVCPNHHVVKPSDDHVPIIHGRIEPTGQVRAGSKNRSFRQEIIIPSVVNRIIPGEPNPNFIRGININQLCLIDLKRIRGDLCLIDRRKAHNRRRQG
jgi:hypothetical protein